MKIWLGLLIAPVAWAADAELDRLVHQKMKQDQVVGLALGVVHRGQVVYLKGFGQESRKPQVQVDPKQTRFRWASISKTLTGIVAVRAAERGLVQLDGDIRQVMPRYRLPSHFLKGGQTIPVPSTTTLSLRQLLSHTGGIQHYSNSTSSPTPPAALTEDPRVNTGMRWALAYWVSNPLVALPGREYQYSTPGFNLAGVVLERAVGFPFEQIVRRYVARPASMTSLRADTLWNQAPRRAKGYRRTSLGLVEEGDNDVSWKLAGGGFISTSQDITRYAQALVGNRFLSPREKAALWTRSQLTKGGSVPYGLGWQVGLHHGRERVRHSGAQQKARSLLVLYPGEKFALTLLTNAGHTVGLTALSNQLESVIRRRVANGEPPIQE